MGKIMKRDEFLNHAKDKLLNVSSRAYDKQGFMNSIVMAFNSNNDLMECLKTPAGQASLFNALQYAASTGLSLNPLEGKACLVPYKGKAAYQIMKNGYIELAMDSGKVSFITSDLVRKNDKFKTWKSMDGDKFEYEPATTDRGPVIGFFAALKKTDGTGHVKYMTKEEIEEHRDNYAGDVRQFSAWGKSFNGMALKTVMKALLTNVEISGDIDAAIGSENVSFQNFENPIDVTEKGTTAGDVREELSGQEDAPAAEEDVPEAGEPDDGEAQKTFEDRF